MKKNKMYSVLLVILILITSIPAMASSNFVDMPNDWSRPGLENAVKNGLMHGYDGKIRPNDTLTRAEMAAISSRMLGLKKKASLKSYSDIDTSKWYYDEMSKAVAAKIIEGSNGKLYPNDPITREEVFVILGRILDLSQNKKTNKTIVDYDEISSWAKKEINALTDSNYIQGDHKYRMNPNKNITRAEIATALDNIIREYIQVPGLVKGKVVNGNLLINEPGVSLEDIKVKGDLILADGIGMSEIYLTNVDVEKRILVRGGSNLELVKSESDIIRLLNVAEYVEMTINKDSHVNKINTDTKINLKGNKRDLTVVFNKGSKDSKVLNPYTNVEVNDGIYMFDRQDDKIIKDNLINVDKKDSSKYNKDKEIVIFPGETTDEDRETTSPLKPDGDGESIIENPKLEKETIIIENNKYEITKNEDGSLTLENKNNEEDIHKLEKREENDNYKVTIKENVYELTKDEEGNWKLVVDIKDGEDKEKSYNFEENLIVNEGKEINFSKNMDKPVTIEIYYRGETADKEPLEDDVDDITFAKWQLNETIIDTEKKLEELCLIGNVENSELKTKLVKAKNEAEQKLKDKDITLENLNNEIERLKKVLYEVDNKMNRLVGKPLTTKSPDYGTVLINLTKPGLYELIVKDVEKELARIPLQVLDQKY